MDCKVTREEMQLYIDAELPDEQLAEVRQHIEACSDCRRLYENELNLKTMVHDRLPKFTPALGLLENVRERVLSAAHTS
ncbi:MAG: zf-HC2 domain-containing protein [Bacteroidota bacterium]|nr:zf-HC2 domain-containing protein [Bacteroidota bacterium]